jgi:UrcA family protein
MFRFVAAAAALSCAMFASPALAKEEFVQVKGTVSHAGLDLNNPAGAAEFDRRVARTARFICRRGVPTELQYGRLVNECRASVKASGREQLAELHAKLGAGSGAAAGE